MAAPRPGPSSSRRPTQVPPEQEPDEIIGDFRRGKEIGKGSFASVYLAQHRVGSYRSFVLKRQGEGPIRL